MWIGRNLKNRMVYHAIMNFINDSKDVHPYVLDILSWIDAIRTEIATFSHLCGIIDGALTPILDSVFAEILWAISQIDEFSKSGMIQLVIDVETLFQTFVKHVSPRASQTIQTIFGTIEKKYDPNRNPSVSRDLTLPLERAKEIMKQNRVKIREKHPQFFNDRKKTGIP